MATKKTNQDTTIERDNTSWHMYIYGGGGSKNNGEKLKWRQQREVVSHINVRKLITTSQQRKYIYKL